MPEEPPEPSARIVFHHDGTYDVERIGIPRTSLPILLRRIAHLEEEAMVKAPAIPREV